MASVPKFGTRQLLEVVEALPVGIQIVDDSGVSIYANKAGVVHGGLSGKGRKSNASGLVIRYERVKIHLNDRPHEVCLSYNVTEQCQREDELYKHAYFDVLTGLPNRAFLEQTTIEMIQEPGVTFALAFIDLDGFKQVNDVYGHTVGDALLVHVAERLSAEVRKSDILARIGGDEFMLCLSPVASKENVSAIVDRCLRKIKQPFEIAGQKIFASASIGVSFYPGDGDTFAMLCAAADHAMYGVKADTKGRFQFYDCGDRHPGLRVSIADLRPDEFRRRAADLTSATKHLPAKTG
ncbi:GGDEF domain-containing protein [Hoeflea poritis]|uniref:GGDEF domain-containing protein n=1 Tax=Hoeflea poritis TaxID=2993659 RepID=A0ABT4VVW0_9HYPH|nr:GGDEF domain-containing protein [Hoeflea poritis]MDA4848855.1 GGDEF domain-containing protein [Hoeflea poritis]